MKLYEVKYQPNTYSEPMMVRIVAGSAVKAAQEIQKKKFNGYNKIVTEVAEKFDVTVAK